MSEYESKLRSELAYQIGPAIGEAIPEVVKIIHHSSTRRKDGATAESDLDLTLVIDNYFLANTNTGERILKSTITRVLKQFNLGLGEGPMQVHLSLDNLADLEDPEANLEDKKSLRIFKEIMNKGEVVYIKKYLEL